MVAAEDLVTAGDVAAAESLAGAALTLARRFAAGATLWCVSPQWPAHGCHVAVEFVHPVIVGKRALPAVYLEADASDRALRVLARCGDVLLVIARADDGRADDLLLRAQAWGLTRIWLGTGTPAPSGRADHVVVLPEVEPSPAAHSGDVVLLYHLLWELTHVVFEHPGLLDDDGPTRGKVCVTCADEGRVGEVRTVRPDGQAEVVLAGRPEVVDLHLIDPVTPGTLVLVHAGVALTILSGPGGARP